jgi:Na+/phosphate symporter
LKFGINLLSYDTLTTAENHIREGEMKEGLKEDIKLQTKNILKSFHEMGSDAEDCISLLQTAFMYNTSLPVEGCKTKVEAVKKKEDQLTKKITEIAASNPDLASYVSVSIHLLGIWENLRKLSELIDKKISDNVLFSDKAVHETLFLLQRLIEILRPTSDIILAKNTFLGMYIRESQAGVEKMAAEYATLHENRLITGECLPAGSSIYISMLDAIKSIAWHTKEIAVKLTGG